MARFDLETTFRHGDALRDNFLARAFGIISEEIVRIWCNDDRAPYRDLGRPTLYEPGSRWSTLDFTLAPREGGEPLVAEMKCELSYDDFRYLRLGDVGQLDHHSSGSAFKRFLTLARDRGAYEVKVGGNPIAVGGTALVWGSVGDEGRRSVIAETGIDVVLSLEDIVNDLIKWQSEEFREFISSRERWVRDMCNALVGERA